MNVTRDLIEPDLMDEINFTTCPAFHKKVKSSPSTHEGIRISGGRAPLFLTPGTRQGCMVSFIPQPLYPQVKCP